MKFIPMSPHRTHTLPEGKEWGHQLKWDGYRAISFVEGDNVTLYSKSMNDMTDHYPEIVKALAKLPYRLIADGEIVMMNPETMRPDFQMLQNRTKRKTGKHVQYILFDLLQLDDQDLRSNDFRFRHKTLDTIGKRFEAPLFTTDLWENGNALWHWVSEHDWEGVVSKRLSSPYREGKQHQDWYKRKTTLLIEAEAVGFLYRDGRMVSLVLRREDQDFGRVSSGLSQAIKTHLARLPIRKIDSMHSHKQEQIHWLQTPLTVHVTGSEITNKGLLRHPQLFMLEGVRI